MKKSSARSVVIAIFLVCISGADFVFAHGGGHGPATASPSIPGMSHEDHSGTSAETDQEELSTYGNMESENEDMGGEGTYGIETAPGMEDHSRHKDTVTSMEPGLFKDPLIEMEPTKTHEQHDSGRAMGSHEQHVEPTSFSSVPSDAPGHGMAIGLTVFAGLTFGLLTLIRPFEK